MRFYDIIITDPASGAVLQRFTNRVNGRVDMGALDIELDIPLAGLAEPIATSAFVRVWGVSLQQIAQSTSLTGKNIQIYGGMQAGLPLAKPAQAGLLLSGTINPAYANWIGTAMTLDLQIVPYLYAGLHADVNITLNWKAGTPLATALQNALAVAFPAWKSNIAISPNLVQNHDEPGFYGNLQQLAQWLKQKTAAMLGGSYQGVDLYQVANFIVADDGTQTSPPKQINFEDMIGQPTWLGLFSLQLKTVMRADIACASYITLPPALSTLTSQAVKLGPPDSSGSFTSISRQNSAFQGSFRVIRARHVGRLRQPDAFSWNTTFDLIPTALPPLPANSGPPIGTTATVTLGEPVITSVQ